MGTSKRGTKAKASKNDPGYTDRKRLFVEAYCGPAGMNATKAAEMTGYAAGSIGKLMSDPWILRAIEQGKEEKRKEFALETRALVQYFVRGMTADPLDYLHLFSGGTIDEESLKKVPLEIRQLMHIKKVKPVLLGYDGQGEEREPIIGHEYEFTFIDKLKCAEHLARHIGMFKESDKPKETVVDEQTIAALLRERATLPSPILDVDAEIKQLEYQANQAATP